MWSAHQRKKHKPICILGEFGADSRRWISPTAIFLSPKSLCALLVHPARFTGNDYNPFWGSIYYHSKVDLLGNVYRLFDQQSFNWHTIRSCLKDDDITAQYFLGCRLRCYRCVDDLYSASFSTFSSVYLSFNHYLTTDLKYRCRLTFSSYDFTIRNRDIMNSEYFLLGTRAISCERPNCLNTKEWR